MSIMVISLNSFMYDDSYVICTQIMFKQCRHVCIWERNDFRLKVQADVNSKKQCSMCVHG